MRRLLGLLASSAVVGASIALAAPTHAADATATCDVARSFNITVATGGTYEVLASTGCVRASWTWNMPTTQSGITVTLLPSTTLTNGIPQVVSLNDRLRVTNSPGSPTSVVLSLAANPNNNIQDYVITFSGSGGGGGGSSSSAPASAPTLETLEVGVSGSDTTCTGGNPTGFSGSWLQLPSAGDCQQTGPKANPNAKLLGWATDPNFPVAIAQRQVNNGWGAYETFNAEGAMTGVFIPAGGSTFISGSNTLYPIWSS